MASSATVNKKKDKQEQVAEIIKYHPGWIIRNGNLVFLCFILLCLLVSFFVYYPEVVTVSGRLIQDDAIKTELTGTAIEEKKLKGHIVVDRSLLDKIQTGDKIAINFENNPGGGLHQLIGTVADILTSPGLKDSTLLYISLDVKVSREETNRLADNLVIVRIRTRGQRLSHYMWEQIKGFFKPGS
jgi:hypothetical protein